MSYSGSFAGSSARASCAAASNNSTQVARLRSERVIRGIVAQTDFRRPSVLPMFIESEGVDASETRRSHHCVRNRLRLVGRGAAGPDPESLLAAGEPSGRDD